MKKYTIIYLFVLIIISCNHKDEKNTIKFNTVRFEKVDGFVNHKDSNIIPDFISIDERKLKKIKIPKLKIAEINNNVHLIKNTKPLLIGKPKLIKKAKDSVFFINSNFDKDNIILAGMPEVVFAKDATTKYPNPQSFTSYSKLQGLKQQSIYCMLEDLNGNLWFGTNGGGVSKFDGKSFSHYSDNEGLSNNEIRCILKDKKENLWFVTYAKGVCRFDGKSFTRYTSKEGLSNNEVLCLLEDKNGSIWFGCNGGGVCKFSGTSFTKYTIKSGLSDNVVLCMLSDKQGNLWFGTNNGGVNKFDGVSFTHYTEKEGLSSNSISCMLQDRTGNFWFGTNGKGLNKFDGKYITKYSEKNGLCNNYIRCLLEDINGKIWIGTNGGISKLDGNSFTNYTTKEGLTSNVVLSILEDKTSNLWFGTYNGGVNKFDGRIFTHYTDKDGLSNNYITSIFKDKKARLWLGLSDGEVNLYEGNFFYRYKLNEGFANADISCIMEDNKGNIWFASHGKGICKFDGEIFTFYSKINGLSNIYIYCMLYDSEGNLWIGTYGDGIIKFNGKSFINFTTKEGLSSNNIFSIAEDAKGDIWFGTSDGIVNKYNGKKFIAYKINKGLQHNAVRCIIVDNNQHLWFGTYGGGVSKFDGKYVCYFSVREGLPSNNVLSAIQDKKGNLWFGTSFGLSKLSAESLKKIDNLPNYNIQNENAHIFKNYTYEDGFLGVGVNTGKTICEDNKGTIWVAANDRLTAFHPEGDKEDSIPPIIQLNSIELFNEKIDWSLLAHKKDTFIVLGNGVSLRNFNFSGISQWNSIPQDLSLAYNNNYLTFKFIGITQKSPKKVLYRSKLEGLEENWNAPSKMTDAYYGNLPPGNYIFKVKTMNSDGYWSNEFRYNFTIRPPWWKTWLAYISYFLIILSSIWVYINLRLRYLKERQKVLETTVKVRTTELEMQKRLSDELLMNILPEEVAEELKQTGKSEAKQFDKVTVIFTDFKDFTLISQKLTPSELVEEIHTYYKVFDQIVGKYNIEKIKTIGDSYMCAGGLPVANTTNAYDTVCAAIEIRDFMINERNKRIAEGRPFFEIRIGCNSGPVVAGIVGVKKYAYDIWGDTVNLAARMEQNSEAGKINISGSTYNQIKDKFKCTYRGKIEAKNKGLIDMYFVEDRIES